MDPCNFFPEEVWSIVFQKLESKEAHHFSQGCSLFDDFLHQKKTTLLFPMVFPILENWLSLKDALKCRLVSKHWRRSVQTHFESLAFHQDTKRTSRQKDLRESWTSKVNVTKFTTKFEGHANHNPFPSRYLCLTIGNCEGQWDASEQLEAFLTTLIPPLEKFGKFVWHLEIIVEGRLSYEDLYQKVVHRALSFTTNLRSLSVAMKSNRFYNMSAADWEKCAAQVKKLTRDKPLPLLPKLVTLTLENLPHHLSHALVRSADQRNLRTFRMQNFDFYPKAGCEIGELVGRFPNLEEISLRGVSRSGSLAELQNATWRLKNVNISTRLANTGKGITIGKLFETVNRFGESLQNLELTLDGSSDDKDDSQLRLKLPLLQTLKIVGHSPVTNDSLDFAEELKELRVFHFWCLDGFSSTKPQLGRLIDVEVISEMRNSNIWTVLPKLKEFSVIKEKVKGHYVRDMSSGIGMEKHTVISEVARLVCGFIRWFLDKSMYTRSNK